jgi:hypothetical protein
LQTFTSFAEAEAGKRLELLERLRQTHYPDEKTPPRVQRVLEIVSLADR